MAYACLGGQMDDPVDVRVGREGGLHRIAVGDIELREGKALDGLQRRAPRLLERRVVVGIEVVEAEHPLAAGEQGLGDVRADEAGCAGDDDGHPGSFEAAGLGPSYIPPERLPTRLGSGPLRRDFGRPIRMIAGLIPAI